MNANANSNKSYFIVWLEVTPHPTVTDEHAQFDCGIVTSVVRYRFNHNHLRQIYYGTV